MSAFAEFPSGSAAWALAHERMAAEDRERMAWLNVAAHRKPDADETRPNAVALRCGGAPSGEANGHPRQFTPEQVREIRLRYAARESTVRLAVVFDCSASAIERIVKRQSYGWVP